MCLIPAFRGEWKKKSKISKKSSIQFIYTICVVWLPARYCSRKQLTFCTFFFRIYKNLYPKYNSYWKFPILLCLHHIHFYIFVIKFILSNCWLLRLNILTPGRSKDWFLFIFKWFVTKYVCDIQRVVFFSLLSNIK